MRRGLYDFAESATRMFRRRRRPEQAHSRFARCIRGQVSKNRRPVIRDGKRRIGGSKLRLRSRWQIIALAIHHNIVSAA
jgi:hypothetical protein